MTFAVNIAQSGSNNQTFRNRIINGQMQIDQRNAGASVTVGPSLGTGLYALDRWFGFASSTRTFTVQRSSVAPAGFINSSLLTVGVSGSPSASEQILFGQNIEGLNVTDFGWGTANAQPITVSFWVRSSIVGTYGCAIHNNNGSRCYPTTYTINVADTWEQKTITIPGDTSGTWLTNNGIGLNLRFDLGSGSNYNGTANAWTGSFVWRTSSCVNWIANSGATLYFTGVQLEKGTAASPFEYRLYSTELALCQRYYTHIVLSDNVGQNGGNISAGYQVYTSMYFAFKQTMRSSPTILQNFTIATNDVGVQSFTTSVDGYVVKHGNTSALYTYIEQGTAKFSAEL